MGFRPLHFVRLLPLLLSVLQAPVLAATPTIGQQEARRATVVTLAGDVVEGIFRGFADGFLLVDVAGQTIRVPVQEVRYVSFVGRLEAAAVPAPTSAAPQPSVAPPRQPTLAPLSPPVAKRSATPSIQPDSARRSPGVEQRSREWRQLKSPDLLIIGNTSDGDLRRIAVHLDRFRQSLGALFSGSSLSASKPTVVVVFKDHDSFRPYIPIENGRRPPIGGYFVNADDAAYVVMAQPYASSDSRIVVLHEYVHFVVSQRGRHLPTWLREGLAEFYSTFRSDGPNGMNVIGEPDPERLRTLRGGSLLPIRVLMKGDVDAFDGSVNSSMFYAQSWALVHFLILGQEGKRLPQLNRYVAAVERGSSQEQAFDTAFGGDYDGVERELRNHIRRFSFPTRVFASTGGSSVGTGIPEPMGEIEALHIQADLLLENGLLEDAEVRLSSIHDLDPGNVRAFIATGRLWSMRGRYSRSLGPLKKALAADSSSYVGHYWLAQALEGIGQDDQSLTELGAAASLKLDDPRLLVGLSVAYLKAGRFDEATQAFGHAHELDPDPNWHSVRAYRLLALDQGAQAASEAEAFLRTQGRAGDTAAYMAIVAALGFTQAGQPQDARRHIDEAMSRVNAKSWAATLLRFLSGAMSVNDLLAQADTVDKKTEAYTYAGLVELYAGRTDSARRLLTWVVENGNYRFNEHQLASKIASRRTWVGGQR